MFKSCEILSAYKLKLTHGENKTKKLEFSVFVLNDHLNIPSMVQFQTLHDWLVNLQSSYTDICAAGLHDDEIGILLDRIQRAVKLVQKTRFLVSQHSLLSSRVLHFEARLESIHRRGRFELYYSVWNQLQVYRGIATAYKKALLKVSTEMVNSCIVVDNLHGHFLRLRDQPLVVELSVSGNCQII